MSDPTFQQIVDNMVASLKASNSQLTDFTATSVVYQILQAVSAQIDQVYYAKDQSDAQANVWSAAGPGLDAKGQDYSLPRKQATPAILQFQFIKNVVSTSPITIPAGTVITTIPQPSAAPVTYKTNADSFLPAGTATVNIKATAQTAGTVGNIAPNTPVLIGSALPGIDGVSLPNWTNATMGTDIETDDNYRSRLLDGLASKAQGTKAWYEGQATSVTGIVSAKVLPQNRGAGTVDIYIVGTGNTIPSTALINQVQDQIDANRVITDDAKVFPPTELSVSWTITVKVAAGTDLAAAATQIQAAIVDYINGLGIGAGDLGMIYGAQINAVALSVPGSLTVVPEATPLADISVAGTQLPTTDSSHITVNTTH